MLVDLARLFPPSRLDWGRDTPMWARAQGLRVDRPVRAEVSEWVVTGVGDWVAVCRGVHLMVGGTDLVVDLLVPAAAIDRRGDVSPPNTSR